MTSSPHTRQAEHIAPGSVAAQIALAQAFARYEASEGLARISVWQQVETDRVHGLLLLAAMRCGFDPAGVHRHVTLLDWSGRRVRLIARTLTNNLIEAARAA